MRIHRKRGFWCGPGLFVVAVLGNGGATLGQIGACCRGDGVCLLTNASGCAVIPGEFVGTGTDCKSVVCTGACCQTDKTCTPQSANACTGAGGDYQGAQSDCASHCPAPQGTTFTYQGQLKLEGTPLTDRVDLEFSLWTSALGGEIVGQAQSLADVDVVNGLFTVALDFGGDAFFGNTRWLQIEVRRPHAPTDTLPFTTLAPRQLLRATPFAARALSAQTVSVVDWSRVINIPENVSAAFSPWGSQALLAGWGLNNDGRTDVPTGTFTAVAAGGTHSLAIRSDGTLVGWGRDLSGVILDVPTGTFAAVAAGDAFGLAIRSDGTLVGWGYNVNGETDVPTGTFTAVAAGDNHGLAIRSDGTLVGWGYNFYGQINVPPGTFTAVAAGFNHSLAIRSDGTLFGWGRNDDGQTNVPTGTFTAVAAGGNHSLGIRGNGTLVGWGRNANGQTNVPTGTFTAVAAGGFFGLAIRSDGTLVGWGYNGHGEINVPPGTFTSVSAGEEHGLAILRAVSFDGAATVSANLTVSGKVGIGTEAPHHRLRIAGGLPWTSNSWGGALELDSGNALGWGGNFSGKKFGIGQSFGGLHFFRTDSEPGTTVYPAVYDMIINDFGNIGMGGRSPTANKLEIEGNASKSTAGSWLANSDAKIKNEVRTISNALETLDRVRLVEFRYTDEYRTAHPEVKNRRYQNVVAQEFREVFPDHVQTSGEKLADGTEILQVDSYPLTIYSAAAVQELYQLLKERNTELDELKSRLRELERRVEPGSGPQEK